MLLLIDAGNTNIVFALSDGEKIERVWRCESNAGLTESDYTTLFLKAGVDTGAVDIAIMGSVVPALDQGLATFCKNVLGAEFIPVTADVIDLDVQLARPQEVGADRLINAYAANRDYGYPAIIVDFGTATTFDVIDEQGAYCGGVIAPGVNLAAEALHERAAKLPAIDISRPERVVGVDTVTAMQSGLFWGYVGMVEGLLERIIAERGFDPKIIATGGLAPLFEEAIPAIEKTDHDLTLRGLLYIYKSLGAKHTPDKEVING